MKRFIFGGICSAAISLFLFSGISHALVTIDTENPQLHIKAVDAGRTVDGVQNVGELVEISNSAKDSISLTGFSIRYTNSGGTEKDIFAFPDDSMLTGESLLLRLQSVSDGKDADLTYSSPNLAASAGKIELVLKISDEEEKILDKVCWGKIDGEENCLKKFDKTTIVFNDETKIFEHLDEYIPDFTEGRKVLTIPEEGGRGGEEEDIVPQCRGLIFSEILSYYESSNSEQFIEFYNSTSTQINLNGCAVRYKNKSYILEGIVQPEGYFAYFPADFTLTKNPTNSNIIEIIDADGEIVDTLEYYNGQKKGVSYAMFGYDENGKENWLQTFAPTAGSENNYQKYKSCEEGKVLNEETGNCVKATSLTTSLAACPEGSYRNPLTNRCKKYETTTTSSLKDCAEGYERNPDTNRCRKIVTNDGAKYEIKTENFEEKSSFVAVWAIVGVGILGAIYVIFEYREEILGIFRRKN